MPGNRNANSRDSKCKACHELGPVPAPARPIKPGGATKALIEANVTIEKLTNTLANLKECWETSCAHVKEALELLGVDVSVKGYIPDTWTLLEQCKKIAGERDALRTALTTALRDGFKIAELDAEIFEHDGWNRTAPYIDWKAARKKLEEACAKGST